MPSPIHSPKLNIRSMALMGLTTAILCLLAPFSLLLPFSPIPISLGTFAIYLLVCIFETRQCVISVLLYILLGFFGLPVFSGFMGGAAILLGPTGGYILGYFFLTLISSIIINKEKHKSSFCLIGLLLGTFVCYLFGTIWLIYQSKLTFHAALLVAVIPFLPGDAIKLAIAVPLGGQLRKRLFKAGLL